MACRVRELMVNSLVKGWGISKTLNAGDVHLISPGIVTSRETLVFDHGLVRHVGIDLLTVHDFLHCGDLGPLWQDALADIEDAVIPQERYPPLPTLGLLISFFYPFDPVPIDDGRPFLTPLDLTTDRADLFEGRPERRLISRPGQDEDVQTPIRLSGDQITWYRIPGLTPWHDALFELLDNTISNDGDNTIVHERPP